MAAVAHPQIIRRLLPENTLTFVSESKVSELAADAISGDKVGQKAVGLASLPKAWTLPFLAVSAELYHLYSRHSESRKELLLHWAHSIIAAAPNLGIEPTDRILVRSSGCNEGMLRRGKFYSAAGVLGRVDLALGDCLNKLSADEDLREERIPFVIQKQCQPTEAKGHLSNERRCYEENRDWMGEIESADLETSYNFHINIRHWRKNLPQKLTSALACALSPRISEVLKGPADWAYRKRARVHFEWVWDGRTVYLVQADEELPWDGYDPIAEHRVRSYSAVAFTPQCLKRVSKKDAARFSKIANVFTYLSLNLPTAPLYILDDRTIIRELSEGKIPPGLSADISEMVKGSLVIRTDIRTNIIREKQLLARSQEIRDASSALAWMVKQSKILTQCDRESAFIFHNFIPAHTAAFAYADPSEPLVQIESLWGLPEGLYYNSHDKYVVDTMKSDIESVSDGEVLKFKVSEKRHFKRFFVSPTESGKWETLSLKAPFDWKGTLSDKNCRRIAYESRRIATAEKHAVSIMWFVGVPKAIAKSSAIPWYHEHFDITASRPSFTARTKTPFDKCYLIQHPKDLDDLQTGIQVGAPVRRIRVQPLDEKLLRDRDTLKRIGELAKEKGAIIVLEGAMLSHAYYQLLSTGAVVEVVHPFIGFEERHAFNKLVRDKVPDLIRQRGELVTTTRLGKEALVRALREKLVEEAYEVLDAKDLRSIIAEIADIKEVVDSLILNLKVSDSAVEKEQHQKRKERGGFADGIVLVETQSLPPTSKALHEGQPQLKGLPQDVSGVKVTEEAEVWRRNDLPERRRDRRVAVGKSEIMASVVVPVTLSSWSAETGEERIGGANGKTITGHIKASRTGSQWNIEMSVRIDGTQLELF